ncbi:putative transcription factor WD40-like family [Helianthus annuus]|nr:putative transcription factor WD40-like family [Helianthus annuus]
MSPPVNDDHGEVFLDEEDIVEEIIVDEEDLPDADSDAEAFGELYTVACSPSDAQLVATGAGDDKGFLWKIGQGDWAFELHGHKDSVSCVAFSCDGQLVASGSFDGIIQVWDLSSRTLKCTLDGPGSGVEVSVMILFLWIKIYGNLCKTV